MDDVVIEEPAKKPAHAYEALPYRAFAGFTSFDQDVGMGLDAGFHRGQGGKYARLIVGGSLIIPTDWEALPFATTGTTVFLVPESGFRVDPGRTWVVSPTFYGTVGFMLILPQLGQGLTGAAGAGATWHASDKLHVDAHLVVRSILLGGSIPPLNSAGLQVGVRFAPE